MVGLGVGRTSEALHLVVQLAGLTNQVLGCLTELLRPLAWSLRDLKVDGDEELH